MDTTLNTNNTIMLNVSRTSKRIQHRHFTSGPRCIPGMLLHINNSLGFPTLEPASYGVDPVPHLPLFCIENTRSGGTVTDQYDQDSVVHAIYCQRGDVVLARIIFVDPDLDIYAGTELTNCVSPSAGSLRPLPTPPLPDSMYIARSLDEYSSTLPVYERLMRVEVM